MEDFLTIDDLREIYNETGLSLAELKEIFAAPRVFSIDLAF